MIPARNNVVRGPWPEPASAPRRRSLLEELALLAVLAAIVAVLICGVGS
jgi:hypothetical protein